MITIKYSKSINEIVALLDGKCYSLKNDLKIIDNPTDLVETIPFLKKNRRSEYVKIPPRKENKFTKSYLSVNNESFPNVLKLNINFSINYAYNLKNEIFFQLRGNLPKYVLNGIANLIIMQYYRDINIKKLCSLHLILQRNSLKNKKII